MVHVLSRRRRGSRGSWTGLLGGLAGLFLLLDSAPVAGQSAPTKTRSSAAAKEAAVAKEAPEPGAAQGAAPAPAPDVAPAPVADPSQTRRVELVEVFKDPGAEAILDVDKVTQLQAVPFTPTELLQVKEMASNPNVSINYALLERVVRGLAARLTDKKSIQSLLESQEDAAPKDEAPKKGPANPGKKPEGDAGKAIQQATTDLLEPIFLARSTSPKNDAFLTAYRRLLNQHLPPLLKNHLVPRVQAMIVLGEAASPTLEGLTIFQNEIANRSQALWVKLWALEGITNIKKGGGRFAADVESKAGRVISDLLERQKDLPWPIQLRAIEALGWLRQGALATEPGKAHMATAAMSFLADPEARIELRAEAARALGLMQVSAIPRFNFQLVAYSAGQLAADLASAINDQYSEKRTEPPNLTKARYLAAMLVGPVYQCYEGVAGESNSGLLQTAPSDPETRKYIQKVFALLKQVAQASVDLIGSPPLQYKQRKQTLARYTADMRSFLEQNPPASRKLVPAGRPFGPGDNAAGAQLNAQPQPLADIRRGR